MSSRSRNLNRSFFRNAHRKYSELLARKKISLITQWTTPVNNPISRDSSITEIEHIWKTGDRYYKLAHAHYGDSTKWWVIAWYNRKPTESDVSLGDVIYIPHPLDKVLSYLGV